MNTLATISAAQPGSVCYAEGQAEQLCAQLDSVLVICGHHVAPENPNISYLFVDDPKVAFYYVSHLFATNGSFELDEELSSHFKGAQIGRGCQIGTDVLIQPGAFIQAGSVIGDRVVVEAGCVVGSTGLLWTWDRVNDRRVMLSLIGGTIIGPDSFLCANVSLVRGASSENTHLHEGVVIAPGSAIGHGSELGAHTHLANNVTLGGGAVIGANCFLGSASCVQPSVKVAASSVIGAAATVVKDALDPGVYVGTPARRIGPVVPGLRGLPTTFHMIGE